jgi:hypothetical protein
MGDPPFVKRFGQASRPGAYLRIVEEGELGAGDAVDVDPTARPDHGVTLRLVSDAILLDHGLIPQWLDAPQPIPSLREGDEGSRHNPSGLTEGQGKTPSRGGRAVLTVAGSDSGRRR